MGSRPVRELPTVDRAKAVTWRRRLRRLGGPLIVCALLLVLTLSCDWTLPLLAGWLDVGQVPCRTDYVMILHGDSEVRPFIAAALVKSGLASSVLLTKLKPPATSVDSVWPLGHEVAPKVLAARGVPPEKIIELNRECTNTFEEASALAVFLRARPDATVSVVTSHFHTRRTRWTIERALGGKAHNIYLVSAPVDQVDPSTWWQFEDSFVIYISEYTKLAFYVMRYGYGVGWCALLAVAAVAIWTVLRLTAGRKRAGHVS